MLAATTSSVTSHTPPSAATRNAGATCHWLAPSSPHGPPSASHDRTASTISQPDGTTAHAAAARPRDTRAP